ncbi:MAG: uracil-DNA glycosylase family protein [Sphingomicrobium sp.]
MSGDQSATDRAATAAALAWWIEAGVDVAVSETPRDWLNSAAPAAAMPEAPPESAATVHEDLSAFRHWLGSEPGLPLDRAGARRVLPHGAEASEIMFLSDPPGIDDGDRPIGGEAWALAVKMLAAIGFGPDAAYSASLACFAAPGAKLTPSEIEACAEIARKHIALARPKRLVLLGEGPTRALLGEKLPQARGRVHKIEGVRTIATFHPRWLLQRPGDKAMAWRDLLLLMEEDL